MAYGLKACSCHPLNQRNSMFGSSYVPTAMQMEREGPPVQSTSTTAIRPKSRVATQAGTFHKLYHF